MKGMSVSSKILKSKYSFEIGNRFDLEAPRLVEPFSLFLLKIPIHKVSQMNSICGSSLQSHSIKITSSPHIPRKHRDSLPSKTLSNRPDLDVPMPRDNDKRGALAEGTNKDLIVKDY